MEVVESAQYTREAGNDVVISAEDETELQARLELRRQAQRDRDFAAADRIRDELRAVGVTINDRTRTFRIDPPQPAADAEDLPPIMEADVERGYSREEGNADVVISAEDEVELLMRLERRRQAQRDQDFTAADQIREELRKVGVTINDRARTFRITAPQDPSAGRRPLKRYEQEGHGYARADEGRVMVSEADMQTIDQLLLQRAHARRQQQYDVAEQLRAQLREGGIELSDFSRTFRVLPRGGGPGDPELRLEYEYKRAENDAAVVLQPDDEAELHARLERRRDAQRQRDFDTANKLREELRTVGVNIDDRTKTYRIKPPAAEVPAVGVGGASADGHGYTRDTNDDTQVQLNAEDEAELHRRLQMRRDAQRTRDFATADRMRDELRALGVILNDRNRSYRIYKPNSPGEEQSPDSAKAKRGRDDEHGESAAPRGKRSSGGGMEDGASRPMTDDDPGAGEPRSKARRVSGADGHGYTRDPTDDTQVQLPAEDEAELHRRLQMRRDAQRSRDFDIADRMRDELRALGVILNDRNRTYRIKPPGQADESRPPPSAPKSSSVGVTPGEGAAGTAASRSSADAAEAPPTDSRPEGRQRVTLWHGHKTDAARQVPSSAAVTKPPPTLTDSDLE